MIFHPSESDATQINLPFAHCSSRDAFSTFGEGVLFPVSGVTSDEPQLVALLPGASAKTRRVLRVFAIQS